MNVASLGLVTASLIGVAACAQTAAPPAAPIDVSAETRLLVKLARPSSDTAEITRLVAAAAAVPARYVAATSADWHAVALRCGAPNACDAALERLRADSANFVAVQRDERMRPATP
jgi:hypothetical protein